jgi:hypothetical protein
VIDFLQACANQHSSATSSAKEDESLGQYVISATIDAHLTGFPDSLDGERLMNPTFEVTPEMAWQYLEGALASFRNLRVLRCALLLRHVQISS